MKKKKTLILLLIILATAIIYGKSLNFDFAHLDDKIFVQGNQAFTGFSKNFFKTLINPRANIYGYLPITDLSYALEATVGRQAAWTFHLTNLLLTIAIAFLLALILLTLAYTPFFAAIAALFFIVLPLHVEPIVWISSRKDLLALLFSLAAFLYYLKSPLRRPKEVIVLLALCSLAAFSKASGGLVALFLAVLFWLLAKKDFSNKEKLLKSTLFFLLFLLFYLFHSWKYASIGSLSMESAANQQPLFANLRLIPLYLSNLVLGQRLTPFYCVDIMLLRNYLPPVSSCLLLLLPLLLILLYFFFKSSQVRLWSIFALIFYLPYANLISTQSLFADRYFLIPSIGYCLLLTFLITRLFAKRELILKFFALFLLIFSISYYSWQSKKQLAIWDNELSLWQRIVEQCPRSPRFNNTLGDIFLRQKNYQQAYDHFWVAFSRGQRYAEPLNNLGLVHYRTGEQKRALTFFEGAKKLDKSLLAAYENEAMVYQNNKKYELANQQYLAILQLAPSAEDSRRFLAQNYYLLGEYEKGVKVLLPLVQSPAARADDYLNLAELYFKAKELKQAIPLLEKGIERSPEEKRRNLRLRLAQIYLSLGAAEKSLAILKKNITIDPLDQKSKTIYNNVLQALIQQGFTGKQKFIK